MMWGSFFSYLRLNYNVYYFKKRKGVQYTIKLWQLSIIRFCFEVYSANLLRVWSSLNFLILIWINLRKRSSITRDFIMRNWSISLGILVLLNVGHCFQSLRQACRNSNISSTIKHSLNIAHPSFFFIILMLFKFLLVEFFFNFLSFHFVALCLNLAIIAALQNLNSLKFHKLFLSILFHELV